MNRFYALRLSLSLTLACLAPTAFAQSSSKLLFDLKNFSGPTVTFQAFNGTAMQQEKGGAGLIKTQYAKSGQSIFDTSNTDWFFTLCVEPTAWLINGATNSIATTKDFAQPWKTPSDPKAGDSLALLYHNFANRNPADPTNSLVVNTAAEQAGLQVAFWEIVNDFDFSKGDFGLNLSQGFFNFQLSYADGSTNRQDIVDSAKQYLTYAKDTLQNGQEIGSYQAQFFHVDNTTDSQGNLNGQDVVGGRSQSIPEPGTLALALLGLIPLVAHRRRNARR